MDEPRKVILYELNEVPPRVLDLVVGRDPHGSLARLLGEASVYRTVTEDQGHLSPWITWPTLHRGVINADHEIYDFGQDLTEVDREFPPIWRLLARNGVKVGMFGSLHSYPLPDDSASYAFYVPDTFAAGPECFPARLEAFQDFNLRMAQRSGRNVARGIALGPALRFLAAAPGLGLRGRTALDLARQLGAETVNPRRAIRRRTSQVQIAFDFFLDQLAGTRPDAAFFFTNHVASSMHRYWPATFPEDYPAGQFGSDWRSSYDGEIPFTMAVAERQIADLVTFVRRNDDYRLVIASSMGQAAVPGRPVIHTQLVIGSQRRFTAALGLAPEDWRPRPNMVPLYTYAVAESAADGLRAALGRMAVNGKPLKVTEHERGVFVVALGQTNLDDDAITVTLGNRRVPLAEVGLVNLRIQDEAGSNAYHVPEGSLIVYDPRRPAPAGPERPTISTREIAPWLLASFGLERPGYMVAPGRL